MAKFTYNVKYKLEHGGAVHGLDVVANNKDSAYYTALSIIHGKVGVYPVYAYVHSITYQNGKCKVFKQ